MTNAMDDRVSDDEMAWSLGMSLEEYRRECAMQQQLFSQVPTPNNNNNKNTDPLDDLEAAMAASLNMSVYEYRCHTTQPQQDRKRKQEEAGERLARQLQAEEKRMQEQESEQLARLLQEEGIVSSGYNFIPLKEHLSKEDRETYQTITQAAGAIKHDTDVHSMTGAFARPHYSSIKALEQKYLGIVQNSPTMTLEDIEKEIGNLAQRNQAIADIKGDIDVVLGKIRGYWNAPVDNETGLDVREVISNTFILARASGDDALANLCITIADNTQTGGGCHPGVTGRLALSYFHYISSALAS